MENYAWRLKGLSKGVDPESAGKELERLKELNGVLTPEIIVKAAEAKRSVLHPLFDWDDEKAGYHWRIQQARVVLNNVQVVVISDGETRSYDVYEVVSSRSEGYKSIDTFTPDDIEYIRSTTKCQLVALQGKLKMYVQFDRVRQLITEAAEAI